MCSLRLHWLGLILLGTVGCQQGPKVDLLYQTRIEPHATKVFLLTAIEKDEPVTVTATTGNAKIDLYILKAQSEDEATTIIDKQSAKDMLASRQGKANPQFDCVLAAHTRYVLAIHSKIDANVTVKITSR
jgi:hypothetical protein